jgi:hypothetical protein
MLKLNEIKSIIKPENGIESAIITNVEFIEGVNWGKVRPGHPESQVIYHIQQVLDNVNKFYGKDDDRSNLRLIAILHDSFKYKVDHTQQKVGENHHGMIARRFAEKYVNDYGLCKIIELHDEAYNAWQKGSRRGDWYGAVTRANNLISGLMIEGRLDLYLKFYRCDNATGDKSRDNYEWFENLIK